MSQTTWRVVLLVGAIGGIGFLSASFAPARASDSKTFHLTLVADGREQTPEQAAGGRENLRRLRKACETDVKQFCSNVRLGGGRILRCLKEHETEVSASCREALGPPPQKNKP
jgi:hypothetical protein